jgi:hypothetical protein
MKSEQQKKNQQHYVIWVQPVHPHPAAEATTLPLKGEG